MTDEPRDTLCFKDGENTYWVDADSIDTHEKAISTLAGLSENGFGHISVGSIMPIIENVLNRPLTPET